MPVALPDSALVKFQTLLRILFQFENADLNFSIYRVLNFKRAEIDAFIGKRLPDIVNDAFQAYASGDRAALDAELVAAAQTIRDSFGGDAFDASGQLVAAFQTTPLGKKYVGLLERRTGLVVADELTASVYNDLYMFFNRYYEDGDFISKRRRGRDETYALPYNGEEVLLYWANRDQYYIKTDERLSAYGFYVKPHHVVFEVRAAENKHNNNKGKARFYVLTDSDPVAYDSKTKTLTVAFEHRALTEAEAIEYGTKSPQEKINAQTAGAVLASVSDTGLKALLAMTPSTDSTGRSVILRHLSQYTRKNSTDFFIHKDLKTFLRRELDHFIKNDALRLDELISGTAEALDTQVRRARVLHDVAYALIDFLAQVEDFQKRLFEKKKFVVRTDYVFTLDRIPESLHETVFANAAQLQEWRDLYGYAETGRPGDRETGRPGDRETGRPGDRETGRPGDRETGRPGDRETGRPGDRETGRPGDRETGRPGDRETGRPGDRETGRPGDRETGRPGDRETGRPGDRETGRPGDRETGRPGDRETGRPGDRETGRPGDRETGLDQGSLSLGTIQVAPSRRFPVDTRHFSDAFKWRILSQLDDLDANTDGVLFNSENFQALSLMQEKYREQVKCIYIDPPYNTGGDGFLYRDAYQHSSWLSMMENRLQASRSLLAPQGLFCTSIDENEFGNLIDLIPTVYPERVGLVAVRNNPKGRSQDKYLSTSHEYLTIFASTEVDLAGIPKPEEQIRQEYELHDENGFYRLLELRNTHRQFNRVTRRNLWYPIYANKITGQCSLDQTDGWAEVYPLWYDNEGNVVLEGCWAWGKPKVVEDGNFLTGKEVSGRWKVYMKDRAEKDGKAATYKPKTIWDDGELRTDAAQSILNDMFPERPFQSPKSPSLIEKVLSLSPSDAPFCLDYFAGSGTTGHAVINMNREDDGQRKYILVEMGKHFETVLLPRIKKVVYCPDWKDGKPAGGESISQIVKYHTLEQYEDTLNNLEVKQQTQAGQQAADLFGDEYLLRYMLEFETRGSASLLNLSALTEPFSYTLNIKQGDEIKPHMVDLVETFNYLLGLSINKMRAYEDNGREYRAVSGTKDNQRVVIVWRDAKDLAESADAITGDKTFISQTIVPDLLGEGITPDRLFVNSPCAVAGVEAIEPEFKRLMFGEAL